MNLKFVFVFVMYFAIFVSGFIITIALGLTKSNFDGNCPLYLDVKWRDSTSFKIESFGRQSTCNYVIYLPLVSCILFPFIMLLLMGFIIFQTYLGNTAAEKRLKQIPLLIVNCISFALLFIAACIVSTGRTKMCSSLTNSGYPVNVHPTCHHAEQIRWQEDRFRTASFVRDIILGEVVLWLCLIWWLFLIVPEFLALWRRHGLRPSVEAPTPTKT